MALPQCSGDEVSQYLQKGLLDPRPHCAPLGGRPGAKEGWQRSIMSSVWRPARLALLLASPDVCIKWMKCAHSLIHPKNTNYMFTLHQPRCTMRRGWPLTGDPVWSHRPRTRMPAGGHRPVHADLWDQDSSPVLTFKIPSSSNNKYFIVYF